jgi:hypothetical protein
MRPKLASLAVGLVVVGVVLASLVDAVGGHDSHPRSASSQASTLDTAPSTASRRFPGPVEAGGTVVFSPYIGVGDLGTGLYAVSPAGTPSRTLVAGELCCPSWSRADDLLVSEMRPRGRTADVVVRPAQSNVSAAGIAGQGIALGPGVWSSRGDRIALWASSPADPTVDGIYVYRSDGRGRRRITNSPAGRIQRPLGYSPDATHLLYYEQDVGHDAGTIYSVGADGSRRVRLTPRGMTSWCCYFGSPASWSPDGRVTFAAFARGARGQAGGSAVFTTNADGSHLRRISGWSGWITSAHWSPDGRWIVFDRVDRPGGDHDLFLVRPDGTGLEIVASASPDNGGSCCAQWSPNGRALVYESGPGQDRMDLWVANIDGTGIRRLTHAPTGFFTFAWGP